MVFNWLRSSCSLLSTTTLSALVLVGGPASDAHADTQCLTPQFQGAQIVFTLPEGLATIEPTIVANQITGAILRFEAQGTVFSEKESQTRTVVAESGVEKRGIIGVIGSQLDVQSGEFTAALNAAVAIGFPGNGSWTAAVASRGMNCIYLFDSVPSESSLPYPENPPYFIDPGNESTILLVDGSILAIEETITGLRANLATCQTSLAASGSELSQCQGNLNSQMNALAQCNELRSAELINNNQLQAQILALQNQLAEKNQIISDLKNQLAEQIANVNSHGPKSVYSLSKVSGKITRALKKISMSLPQEQRSKSRKAYRNMLSILRAADGQNIAVANERGDQVVVATKQTVAQ